MSYRNKDRVAYATVNGQTGKVSADVPMSIPKYFMCALAIAAVLFAVFQMFFTITPKILVLLVGIIALISVLSYSSEMKKIVSLENYDDDLGMLERERKVEEKKRARAEAQKGAAFEGTQGATGDAYVVTKNDLKRAKKDESKKKKAQKKSGGMLTWIIIICLVFVFGGAFFTDGLASLLDTGNLGIGFGIAMLVLLIIALISTINAGKSISQMRTKMGLPASICSTVSLALITIIVFMNSINDTLYYIIAIIAMVGVILNILGIIRGYNYLAMRPLPQFDIYQGGDDRA